MEEQMHLFLQSVGEENRPFVEELHKALTEEQCKCEIKEAKSGYVVSYVLRDTKKTLMTFVFRKTGIKLRIYADHVAQYQDNLNEFPEKIKKEIRKASICKRLVDPNSCNSKCPMGYRFLLEGEVFEKCRHMAFLITLNEENNPFLKKLLEWELKSRCTPQK